MEYESAITCIKVGQYETAATYLLEQAFGIRRHKLGKRQMATWLRRIETALRSSHQQLRDIRKGMGYTQNDIAQEAYQDVWHSLGFDEMSYE